MNIKGKASFSPDAPGKESVSPASNRVICKRLDSNTSQRQRILMEPDKQVDKRRARQDEYWRQRTLARQIQMQRQAQAEGELQAGEQALEKMDSRHRTGKLLNFFMDAYNDLKPAEPFFPWIESLTQIDQLKILQKVMTDRGYGGIVNPEWIRSFKRGCRCMHASCDCVVEAMVQGESARGDLAVS